MLGVAYAIGVIAMRWFFDIEAEGWASLMVVILVVSGVQLLMTGVLGEYMWRNLDETRRRPRYVVEHVIENRAVVDDLRPIELPAESLRRQAA
jgi:polyisoprenyl-phosphate glycosyltransferase